MEQHMHPEERTITDWRSSIGRGGRVLWGAIVSGAGGFWLVNNLTHNAALIAQNSGRVVFPAMVILIGIVAMFNKREPRRTNVE